MSRRSNQTAQTLSTTENTETTTKTTHIHSPNGAHTVSAFSEIVGVIGKVYRFGEKAALTHNIAAILAGCSKKKGWQEYNVEPSMTAEEVARFFNEYAGDIKPQRPINIQAEVYKWRNRRPAPPAPVMEPEPEEDGTYIDIPEGFFERILK